MRFATTRAVILTCMVMLCHVALALDPHQPLRQFGHQTWQSNDGLPQNSIHSIVQTGDGYIWFATEDGLVRFDSTDFTIFNTENTPQLHSNSIRHLLVDRSGALWISTAEGVVRYWHRQFSRFGENEGLPSNAVWFLHQSPSGRLIASTAAGLAVFADNRWQLIAATAGLSVGSEQRLADTAGGGLCVAAGTTLLCLDGQRLLPTLKLQTLNGSGLGPEIDALACDGGGRLWVGTKDGLKLLSHSKLTPVNLPHGSVEITSLLFAKDQTLWVGTARGLAHQVAGKFIFVEQELTDRPTRIDTLFADREGALWAGTDHGAARFSTDTSGHLRIDRFRAVNSLSGSNLLAAFEDREGNQWLGTESEGVTILREQQFTTYTTDDGLSGNVIRAIAQAADGRVWIGTDGAGLDRQTLADAASTSPRGSAPGFTAITMRDGLSSNVVLSIAPAPNGDVWVGTPSGLDLIQADKIRAFTSANGLADDYIRSLYFDRDGSLWIGTRHGLSHRQGDATVNYSAMDGLGSDYIGAMLRARNGDLWICTSSGLTRMRDGRFRNFNVPGATIAGGIKSVVTTLYEDAAGTLWLGATEGGLYRMGADEILPVKTMDRRSALPASVSGILEDDAGNLWLSSTSGIFRVGKSNLNDLNNQNNQYDHNDHNNRGSDQQAGRSRDQTVSYGTADGMLVRECSSGGHPAVWHMRDGTLWFATLRGVVVANPQQAKRAQNSVGTLPAIEAVLVDDQRIDDQRIDDQRSDSQHNLELVPGNHRIEVRYAGLSFAAPWKVRYRYKLDGFDPQWVDAGNRRTAFYTNLPPGRYTFRIMAAGMGAGGDGSQRGDTWSERDASLGLRIDPYFYQTNWFRLALALSGMLVIWQIYRWRLRRVESTFTAVLGERNRIAREIHDTLAQGIVSISLQLEIVSRLLSTSTEAARTQLDQTRSLVRQSLADARSSIWELRSQQKDLADLPARIGGALQRIELPAGTQLHLQVTGTYRAVDARIEKELLRIAQEAVTNAARHAHAGRIDVLLGYDQASVSLLVQDDGQGFEQDRPHPPGHFGIQGMRERAQGLGGNLEIISEAGKGTLVRVKVNL